MKWQPDIVINEKLYIKDPKATELGQRIIQQGIIMIEEMGLEEFTFKKLANNLDTTEASIYRYFENKQLLLLYALNWYWNYLEFLISYKTQNIDDKVKKLNILLDILLFNTDDEIFDELHFNKKSLHMLVVKESAKSYLNHNVQIYNENQFYKPYKSLCQMIADVLLEINPDYPYSKSMATTLLLMSRNLYFFMNNLPSLADFSETNSVSNAKDFLRQMILSSLEHKAEKLNENSIV
ncbi:MAG: TetR/AcrR family transcriptional regulator [Bacteroidota bacterium]|nr:TetR/AcrR family transcriptional regulator [Bacteroidota bacterium]